MELVQGYVGLSGRGAIAPHASRLLKTQARVLRCKRGRGSRRARPASRELGPVALFGFLGLGARRGRKETMVCGSSRGGASQFNASDYYEATIQTVSHTKTYGHVVYLALMDGQSSLLPIYVGSFESAALIQQINNSQPVRPSTHDLMKNTLEMLGHKVSMVRVTDLVSNTYYARVHYKYSVGDDSYEVDVDARPSDAINLAVRFEAPIYVNRKVAARMAIPSSEVHTPANSDVVQSCRAEVLQHQDPTVMMKLQLQVAIADERYGEAAKLRDDIDKMLATDRTLRLVVAMESALMGNRLEEAVFLRDELRKLRTQKQVNGGGQG